MTSHLFKFVKSSLSYGCSKYFETKFHKLHDLFSLADLTAELNKWFCHTKKQINRAKNLIKTFSFIIFYCSSIFCKAMQVIVFV